MDPVPGLELRGPRSPGPGVAADCVGGVSDAGGGAGSDGAQFSDAYGRALGRQPRQRVFIPPESGGNRVDRCGSSRTAGSGLGGAGVREPTLAQVRNMIRALRSTLDKHAGKTVERVGEGMPARWRLTSQRDEAALVGGLCLAAAVRRSRACTLCLRHFARTSLRRWTAPAAVGFLTILHVRSVCPTVVGASPWRARTGSILCIHGLDSNHQKYLAKHYKDRGNLESASHAEIFSVEKLTARSRGSLSSRALESRRCLLPAPSSSQVRAG